MNSACLIVSNKSSNGRLGGIERTIQGLAQGLEHIGVRPTGIHRLARDESRRSDGRSLAAPLSTDSLTGLRQTSGTYARLILMPSAMMLMENVDRLIDVLTQLGKPIVLDLLFPIEELQLYLPEELSAQVIENLEQLSSVAEFVIVPSRFSEEGLRRNAVVSCPVTVAPLGVKGGIKGRTIPGLISCVARSGRFTTHKNLQILCDSMSSLTSKFPLAQLILISPEPSELSGGSNVRIAVGLADSAMQELIATADISCLPSGIEAFGLSMLESMACGVPAVAANAGALPEMVAHGCNGLLVPVSTRQVNVEGRQATLQQPSVEALSRAIADLLGDRQLRNALAERALADASNYTWDRFAMAHLS